MEENKFDVIFPRSSKALYNQFSFQIQMAGLI
jgi:hypothetical protein